MKSMRYYDYCLLKFFQGAKKEPWFNNTVFIFFFFFWMFPEGEKGTYNPVLGYKIPIIIFDPSSNVKKVIPTPVSQFDILGTVLSIAGYSGTVISYGGNLTDSNSLRHYTFSKPNDNIYQVIDSSFVLGYNIIEDNAEYFFNYKSDQQLSKNLLPDKFYDKEKLALTKKVQAFMQQTGQHFNSLPPIK